MFGLTFAGATGDVQLCLRSGNLLGKKNPKPRRERVTYVGKKPQVRARRESKKFLIQKEGKRLRARRRNVEIRFERKESVGTKSGIHRHGGEGFTVNGIWTPSKAQRDVKKSGE